MAWRRRRIGLLQEGGCVGTRYGSCRTCEFIKRHQHAPGPCASAPSAAVHASLVRAGVFMCGSLPARHHRPLRLVHTNMCLLLIPALFRRRRRRPLRCPLPPVRNDSGTLRLKDLESCLYSLTRAHWPSWVLKARPSVCKIPLVCPMAAILVQPVLRQLQRLRLPYYCPPTLNSSTR